MVKFRRTHLPFNCDLRPQGNITGLTGLMDFKDNGSNAHVQFEILGSSFSETFGKDIKRVSSHRFTFAALRRKNRKVLDVARWRWSHNVCSRKVCRGFAVG